MAMIAESLIVEIASLVVGKYGRQLTTQAQAESMGKPPLEAWRSTIQSLNIQGVTAEQLIAESEPLLRERQAHYYSGQIETCHNLQALWLKVSS